MSKEILEKVVQDGANQLSLELDEHKTWTTEDIYGIQLSLTIAGFTFCGLTVSWIF